MCDCYENILSFYRFTKLSLVWHKATNVGHPIKKYTHESSNGLQTNEFYVTSTVFHYQIDCLIMDISDDLRKN